MISTRNVLRSTGMFTAAWFLFAMASPVSAYTPEQEQMCTGDAMRLCSAEVPDVDRVTACMISKRSQLSAGCAVFFRDPEPERVRTMTTGRSGKASAAKARKSAKPVKRKTPRTN